SPLVFFFFFFQAEDGIRDFHVTGVQTCALPISRKANRSRTTLKTQPTRWIACRSSGRVPSLGCGGPADLVLSLVGERTMKFKYEIGRASCRGRVEIAEDDES